MFRSCFALASFAVAFSLLWRCFELAFGLLSGCFWNFFIGRVLVDFGSFTLDFALLWRCFWVALALLSGCFWVDFDDPASTGKKIQKNCP